MKAWKHYKQRKVTKNKACIKRGESVETLINMENYKDGDRIRIWIEDSMEPEGGFWSYATIKEIVITQKLVISDDCPTDLTNEVEDLKGYKVEKIL